MAQVWDFVLTNKRYKTYRQICCLGHAPEVGLWGAGGGAVKKSCIGICDDSPLSAHSSILFFGWVEFGVGDWNLSLSHSSLFL